MQLPLRRELLDVVSPTTGETVGHVPGPAKRRYHYDESFMTIFQNAYRKLSKKKIGENTRRVLDALIARAEMRNEIRINQTEVGKDIGMRPEQVSKALTKLIDEKIINKIKVDGLTVYMLAPHMGWKGTPEQLHKQKKAERAQTKLRLASEHGKHV